MFLYQIFIEDLNIPLVSEEQVLRDQRKRVKETWGRLHKYWEEYTNDDKSVMQLLETAAKFMAQKTTEHVSKIYKFTCTSLLWISFNYANLFV